MQILPAQPSDATAIAAIHVVAWQHAYRGRMPDDLLAGLSVERRRQQWQGWLTETSGRVCLTIEQDGVIIGFASAGPARGAPAGVGELYAIYLRPDCIGIGAGRRLLVAITRALQERGFAEAILWVLADNPRARGVYEAAGWVLDGGEKTERFGGRTLLEVRYRRPL